MEPQPPSPEPAVQPELPVDLPPVPAGAEPFDPEGIVWSRVSSALMWVRLAGVGIVVLAGLVVAVVAFLVTDWWVAWLAALPGLVIGAVAVVLVPRQVRAWGYAEREEDLVVRHGVMFRTLVVVPYGRMQYVDVSAGPIDRALGLATVRLHTASAATDAHVPGLDREAAARLRDRLTQAGQAQLAGL